MEKEVSEFINLISDKNGIDQKNLYSNLLSCDNGNGQQLMEYVDKHPHVLIQRIDTRHVVFDYFYDYTVERKSHPAYTEEWIKYLITTAEYLSGLGDNGAVIKSDKRYILQLQRDSYNNNDIFNTLIDNYFELGEFEFLLHSIIARGELCKLQKIYNTYSIDEYNGLYDTALRYGRYDIINFLLNDALYDLNDQGMVMNFENYTDSPRYIYYHEELGDGHTDNRSAITSSRQDYIKSIKSIMERYQYSITIKTLDIWCDVIRRKCYLWDVVPLDVLLLLKSYLSVSIPLSHDFNEYNHVIFGHNWSDRSFLVLQCMELQNKLDHLQKRYDRMEYELHRIRTRNEYLEHCEITRKTSRRRCETEP